MNESLEWRFLDAKDLAASAISGTQWSTFEELDRKIDPHLFWAEQSGFAGYARSPEGKMRVAFELDANASARKKQIAWLLTLHAAEQSIAKSVLRRFEIAPAHVERLQDNTCRYFTALCTIECLREVLAPHVRRLKPGFVGMGERPAGGSLSVPPAARIDWHEVASLIARREMDAVRRLVESCYDDIGASDRAVAAAARSAFDAAAKRQAFAASARRRATKRPKAQRQAVRDAALQPLVGVIDFGCAFGHLHMRRGAARTTRICHFWDQGRRADWSGTNADDFWVTCEAFGYGREADASNLEALMQYQPPGPAAIALRADPPSLEQWWYAVAGLPELLLDSSHGTQVLDVAAGCGYQPEGAQPLDADAASQADIIFVQLPQDAVQDLSGSWLAVHVIDAIEYILSKARAVDPARPVVINLSYGNYAGSHDGQSLLEAALDHYAAKGVVIVLAAGNLPDPQRPIHASAIVDSSGSAALEWIVPPNDPTQSFLELWFELRSGSLEDFELEIESPGSAPVVLDTTLNAARCSTPPATPGLAIAAAVLLKDSAGGGRDGMALIACAPTGIDRVSARWPRAAEAGAWRLTVRGKAVHPAPAQVRVSAWIERDEPGNAADPVSTQSWLRCPPGSAFEGSTTATLTALAMGERTMTVGAYTARGAQAARLWPDSGWGLNRLARDRRGPTLVAAGERVVAPELRGIATAGNISALPSEMSGTSIAAAWVTRCALNVVTHYPHKASKADLLKHWGVDPKAQPTEPRGHGALMCDGTLNPHVPP